MWIQTHFNHPREITPEAARVCQALLRAGMPVNNHAVLLKGVNDDLDTMRALMRGLLRIKVRPYYLFHCDPVIGAGHFRTSRVEGAGDHGRAARPHVRPGHPDLRGRQPARRRQDSAHAQLPRLACPTTRSCCATTKGMLVRYQAEDKPTAEGLKTPTRGVSGLLQGDRTQLMPEGNERMARRQLKMVDDPSYGLGCDGGHMPAMNGCSR